MSSRDPFTEFVTGTNRDLVVKGGSIRPRNDFPSTLIGRKNNPNLMLSDMRFINGWNIPFPMIRHTVSTADALELSVSYPNYFYSRFL